MGCGTAQGRFEAGSTDRGTRISDPLPREGGRHCGDEESWHSTEAIDKSLPNVRAAQRKRTGVRKPEPSLLGAHFVPVGCRWVDFTDPQPSQYSGIPEGYEWCDE